ncbi:uncharacterized protein LOC128884410 isoform X2 [Hylaeus volcanicus]|uniref:uncharacterized protein LOC128884410 isoform X2 n=1 Tax=Hylaeus volcanicus TaxID=313075 RepID=UPI0023B7A15C|nr:uncharacterized protein LOC128884410 isoform X2 [Hylaeus volcanicus]
MCLVNHSLCNSNKVATGIEEIHHRKAVNVFFFEIENNVEKELYDLEEQIESLESLDSSSFEILKVLEELKVCYGNLKVFQKQVECERLEEATCETRNQKTTLNCDSNDKNEEPEGMSSDSSMCLSSDSSICLSSDEELEDLSSDRLPKSKSRVCFQSYEETCDGLLLELIIKAWEVVEVSHYLELRLSQFVWGAYFYEHLKAGQLVAFCDFRLNGTPFWNVAQVVETYVDCYDTLDVKIFLKKMSCDTCLDFGGLKRVETRSCDMPVLKDISTKFYVISKVKVKLVAPRSYAEKACDDIEHCTGHDCLYDHGRLIEPQNIRTFLLNTVMHRGRHVVVQCEATDALWKEGKIVKVTKQCVHVQQGECILQIDWKHSCRVLPDLTLEVFKPSELPNALYNQRKDLCGHKSRAQEDNEWKASSQQCVLKGERLISSNDSFGSWEKYTKGFGSRMLMRMGYKLGEALSPPSWKPCHRPKLIEPLSVRVLRPRAGLDSVKDTTKTKKMRGWEKKRFKKASLEEKISACRALRLVNETFVCEPKCSKTNQWENECVVYGKSDAALRQELIVLKDKEFQLKNDISSLQKHVERHQKTKVQNKLTLMYTRKLKEKEKELLDLQKVHCSIKNQLQFNQSTIALQTF